MSQLYALLSDEQRAELEVMAEQRRETRCEMRRKANTAGWQWLKPQCKSKKESGKLMFLIPFP
ncbi:MAG: hypothetical protein OEU84_04770 [Xanthomonadales bacterium]|nr:hypothetical protein [Xanthomonadales bacterium]MDH4018893.1 hypothetical protein [Xanthomonadales bacterium]